MNITVNDTSAGVVTEAAAPQEETAETAADLELWQFSRRYTDEYLSKCVAASLHFIKHYPVPPNPRMR